jgi:hypothetical protein
LAVWAIIIFHAFTAFRKSLCHSKTRGWDIHSSL